MSININIQNSRDFNVNAYSISTMSPDNRLLPNIFMNDRNNRNNLSLSNSIKSLLDKINKNENLQNIERPSESNIQLPSSLPSLPRALRLLVCSFSAR